MGNFSLQLANSKHPWLVWAYVHSFGILLGHNSEEQDVSVERRGHNNDTRVEERRAEGC